MKLGYGKSGNVLLLAGHIQTPCFSLATKKPLNLSIQGLFDIAVWLHDLDSNQGPSD